MSYSIVLLICHKVFLRPTSLLSVMIITMFFVFTYNVVMLITMLFLWLHIVVYVSYFDYVLHCYFTCVYCHKHVTDLSRLMDKRGGVAGLVLPCNYLRGNGLYLT